MGANMNKPPLGLRPREVYESFSNRTRVEEIISAIERYSADNKPIPPEWVKELRERVL